MKYEKGMTDADFEALQREWKLSRGTPADMQLAIRNGIHDGLVVTRPEVEIAKNVRDYLAQKFGPAMQRASETPFTEDDLLKLFKEIVNED